MKRKWVILLNQELEVNGRQTVGENVNEYSMFSAKRQSVGIYLWGKQRRIELKNKKLETGTVKY